MADSLVLDIPDGIYEEVPGWAGMIRHPDLLALTAGAYPVQPPSKWFADPRLQTLTPLTITDDGQVFGHIAAWHTSHIGMAGGVKPPRSKSGYAYYRTGVVKCDDGEMVDVGQITLTGGHAPLNAGVAKAVAHYDDTASAIMDVAAGEDRHGIWVAGALRPDVTEGQLRSIRASSVSGDWRPINGKLELVAVCAVNAPGFPIPRARVASGAPIALVAAGIEPLVEIAMNDRIESHVEDGIKAGLELFRERILRLENVVLADGGLVQDLDSEQTIPEAVDADKLRKRVRGGSALAASLRERVRGPVAPEVVVDVQALAASLRERVKGSDADPKAPAPKALTAARRDRWNPLLHPRGADGRFIEVDSWVRWLRPGFGSTRRGRVIEIVPIYKDGDTDGVPEKVVARVEFPDRNDSLATHDIPFDELEKVAPPKGSLHAGEENGALTEKIAKKAADNLSDEDVDDGKAAVEDAIEEAVDEVVNEALPDTPEEKENPTDEQLMSEELTDLGSENRGPWTETSEWAEAVREVRAQYEEWRKSQREQDAEANVSLDAYLEWLEGQGLKAAIVAGIRSDSRVRGANSLLGRATEYWTDEKRGEASEKGHALPDGSYPIDDANDLEKAVHAFGRAKKPSTTKRHIIKRARQLNKTDLLPEGWTASGFDPARTLTAARESAPNSEADRLRGRVHGTG